jgi:hypothetical protein
MIDERFYALFEKLSTEDRPGTFPLPVVITL